MRDFQAQKKKRTLRLVRESLRILNHQEMQAVMGGVPSRVPICGSLPEMPWPIGEGTGDQGKSR